MRYRDTAIIMGWVRLPFAAESRPLSSWMGSRPSRASVRVLVRYALALFVPYLRASSVFGFALLVNMVCQMASGLLLALYYIPDPSFVMTFREEYMNEVWWFFYVHRLHVVGVDTIFVLSYLHLLKKVYLKNYVGADIDGWVTGVYAFLVYHVVVFLGITLSTNHLGDVTITIVANIYWGLLQRWHKSYCAFFTNQHLNVDQLARFMVVHYIVAYYYTYLIQLHTMFIHEAWDADSGVSAKQDEVQPRLAWLWDALAKEAASMAQMYLALMAIFVFMACPGSRVADYTFFEQWSETEVEEINFFIVAPHWYFRAHMGLLTVCAQFYEGLFWLALFYLALAALPALHRSAGSRVKAEGGQDYSPTRMSALQQAGFTVFAGSMAYVGSVLPCARFYYEGVEGFFGNSALRISYQLLYAYLLVFLPVVDAIEAGLVGAPTSWAGISARLGSASRAWAHRAGAALDSSLVGLSDRVPRAFIGSEIGDLAEEFLADIDDAVSPLWDTLAELPSYFEGRGW